MNIRQKFISLLLLIGLVPMLVVSIIAYMSISNSLLAKTTDQLNSTAVKQEQKISTFLQTRQEEVIKLANQYDLQITLRQFVSSLTAANQNELKLILQNKKIEVSSIQSLFLTDLNGKVLMSSSADVQPETGGITTPASGNETTVTIRKDSGDGFSKLYITTLVSINKQPTALLSAVFRTDDIVAVVQDYTGLDQTGETVVVAKENVSLFPLRFDTDATLQRNLSSLDVFGTDSKVYRQVIDYRNKEVLVVAHPIGLTDWAVATKIDKDEALAPTMLLRNGIIGIVVAASTIIIIVALFFTRLFTRPILAIARASDRIGKGDFTTHASVDRRDEIGALATSINAMGANLKEMVGNIESQRQRLQIILDSTTETIFAIDEHATIILVNRAVLGLLQQPPKEFVGKNINDVFSWQHGLQDFAIDYNVPGVHTYTDLQYTDLLGTKRYVKVIVARVKDEVLSGRAHAIVTIHDETSSHELDNMKADFVSMAAHELRTPLTAVRGYLEMVQYKQEHDDPTDVPVYIRQALKNVGDLGGLINNLLDVTRIERGTLTLSMEKVDIAAEVDRAVQDLQFVAEDRKLQLSFEGRTKDIFVVGDEIALREIMNNLLANAIKYTKSGGSITVTLTKDSDSCTVSIADTGIGIPQDAIPRLFTKFYRVNGGLDSGSSGTGLGLFIAKSIVERHHGTIGVVSKEGVGSTFSFTLPLFTEYRLASARPQDDSNDTTVRRKRGWVTKNIAR